MIDLCTVKKDKEKEKEVIEHQKITHNTNINLHECRSSDFLRPESRDSFLNQIKKTTGVNINLKNVTDSQLCNMVIKLNSGQPIRTTEFKTCQNK
jgi:hypothetical protein